MKILKKINLKRGCHYHNSWINLSCLACLNKKLDEAYQLGFEEGSIGRENGDFIKTEHIDLPVRVINALVKSGFNTLGELREAIVYDFDFTKIRHIGWKHTEKIKKAVKSYEKDK